MYKIFQKYFILFLGSFVLGIAIAGFLPSEWLLHDLLYFSAMIICMIVAVFVRWFCKSWRCCNYALLLAISLAIMLAGLWRFSLSEVNIKEFSLRIFYNQELNMIGRIETEPQTIDKKTQFVFGDIEIHNSVQSGRALATIYNSGKYLNFADKIYLKCKLERPEPIESFRYDLYLAKSDVVALCRQTQVLSVDKAAADWQKSPFQSMMINLLKLKKIWREKFMSSLSTNEGSLLSGIMLGDGYLMSKELKDAYSRSGLSHIVAISGMNMTMIAVFLLFCLVRFGLWRREASLAAIILIWLYTLAIGLPSSAVRASVMSSLVLIAYSCGRLAQAGRLLVLTASVMLIINPRLLRDDVGFQLSFLAFAGLLIYYEPLKNHLGKFLAHKYSNVILEVISLTLSAQILTWPILAANFGQVSWVAPLANLLVLWALGPMMILAFAGIMLSYLMPAAWALAPAYLLAYYQNAVALIIGGWRLSVVDSRGWSEYLFILYYCGIMLVTFRTRMAKK